MVMLFKYPVNWNKSIDQGLIRSIRSGAFTHCFHVVIVFDGYIFANWKRCFCLVIKLGDP